MSTPVEIIPPGLNIPTRFKYLHPGSNIYTSVGIFEPVGIEKK